MHVESNQYVSSIKKSLRDFSKKNNGVLLMPNALSKIPKYIKNAQKIESCCDVIYVQTPKFLGIIETESNYLHTQVES